MNDREKMVKEAQGFLSDAKNRVMELASSGGDRLNEYWSGLGDDTKSTLLNSLIGAGVGGAASGVLGGLSASEGESSLGRALSSGLTGAGLGAAAGGAGTLAYNLLTKKTTFPYEEKVRERRPTPFLDRTFDGLTGAVMANPAASIGTALGAAPAASAVGRTMDATTEALKTVRQQTKEVPQAASTMLKSLEDNLRTSSLGNSEQNRIMQTIRDTLKKDVSGKPGITQAFINALHDPKSPARTRGNIAGLLLMLSAPALGYTAGTILDRRLKGEV